MGQPRPLFVYFQQQCYTEIVDFSRIQTRIVGVEWVHDDHLTNATAYSFLISYVCMFLSAANGQQVIRHLNNSLI